ncbi:hypothetical protein H9651_07280 [Microbacterium sp. Sa4CUA7]|uniref:Flagellar assembly protein FliH/Type III secretion system HrpE domain-containing protein n=1 Tax=Microbacterium pullorum TaxID=2762236 RepID=A0ABR8S1T2_9MICO|nr:hypothetical protein [Microbacterium pullorum]MBD7957437.1 hypothetical protein [Microbacterium pullorum]
MSLDVFTRIEIPRLSGPADDAERERASRRGHAMGYAEGMRLAREEAEREAERVAQQRRIAAADAVAATTAALDVLDRAVTALAERTGALAQIAEERVLALAVELAETILERDLADPVRAALTAHARAERAVDSTDAVIVLSEPDLATLDGLGERPGAIPFESSSELTPGDAVVRVPDGEVDLRVDAALRRARAALAEVG